MGRVAKEDQNEKSGSIVFSMVLSMAESGLSPDLVQASSTVQSFCQSNKNRGKGGNRYQQREMKTRTRRRKLQGH